MLPASASTPQHPRRVAPMCYHQYHQQTALLSFVRTMINSSSPCYSVLIVNRWKHLGSCTPSIKHSLSTVLSTTKSYTRTNTPPAYNQIRSTPGESWILVWMGFNPRVQGRDTSVYFSTTTQRSKVAANSDRTKKSSSPPHASNRRDTVSSARKSTPTTTPPTRPPGHSNPYHSRQTTCHPGSTEPILLSTSGREDHTPTTLPRLYKPVYQKICVITSPSLTGPEMDSRPGKDRMKSYSTMKCNDPAASLLDFPSLLYSGVTTPVVPVKMKDEHIQAYCVFYRRKKKEGGGGRTRQETVNTNAEGF
mmetsp:Transcript_42038/g.59052  ORF Transcript_42038/g.59052 Transcript_42038/m.59052 type:complete len:306 (-) Transcript_42038:278-1195(-)